MKQLHTFLFFFNILVISGIYSQDKQTKSQDSVPRISARDTLPPAEKYGLRAGVDIARLVRSAVDNNYTGFEIEGDYRIHRKIYIAGEFGNESLIRDEENINVEGSGTYIRAGFDYNVYDNWYGMQNSIYVGLRYGFSTFSQELNEYTIFTDNNFFGTDRITDSIKQDGLNAGWLEFVFGLEVELISNIYLGASLSLRTLVNESKPDGFDNLYIPGFGKTNDFNNIGVGYNYTISYLIPIAKRKR